MSTAIRFEGEDSGNVTAEHYSFISNTNEKIRILGGWMAWIELYVNMRD